PARRAKFAPAGAIPAHALPPADTRANQKPVLGRNVLHHFTVLRPEPFRSHSGGVIEHFNEASTRQAKAPEFGKQLLLANAQTECATGQVVRLTVTGLGFNNPLFRHR